MASLLPVCKFRMRASRRPGDSTGERLFESRIPAADSTFRTMIGSGSGRLRPAGPQEGYQKRIHPDLLDSA